MVQDVHDDGGYFGSGLREIRHNPCMMTPISFFMFILFGMFLVVTLFMQVPGLILGLLLAPILMRSAWYVEFLYPWSIARWAHFLLISQSSKRGRDDDKNRGFHSRTVEQKIEVVPGRVYIHPIPQWLDNVGYLVVCLPRPKTENKGAVKITMEDETDPIIALMIDCGDADATVRAVGLIQEFHYGKKNMQIQSILSTHKHHDHTGGNGPLLKHQLGSAITRVYAGAVEKVPHCNHTLTDGEILDLPKFKANDMNELVEIEAIAVPAHTRGSLVFRLRTKVSDHAEFMFTGDTMFSAGGGVPFESDTGTETDAQVNGSNGNTFVRAGLGNAAMERCFAEILSRALPNDHAKDVADRILVFPGHEYTSELLSRQLQGNIHNTFSRQPKDFFETVSQMYVAQHRRSLPHNSGRLLMVPSTLQREIYTSPHFRSMKRNGELVVRALEFWYEHFCKDKVVATKAKEKMKGKKRGSKKGDSMPSKTISQPRKWNVDTNDVSKSVFTTVFTANLESIIEDLNSGKLSKKEAAQQLHDMTQKLNEPVVNKRAIPGFFPSDKSIYKGVCGLVLLGSRPSAMTLSDSRNMKLPPPIDSNSDRIRVSICRLIVVLERLGFEKSEKGEDVTVIIKQLWKEARQYYAGSENGHLNGENDLELNDKSGEIELGVLKWVLYGVPANQPSWFSKICCMPCSQLPQVQTFPDHPATSLNQKSGDLVSHDVLACLLCRNATGCVPFEDEKRVNDAPVVVLPSRKETISEDSEDEGDMDELASHLILKEHE